MDDEIVEGEVIETEPKINVPPVGIVEKEFYYVRADLSDNQRKVLDAYIKRIMDRIDATKKRSFGVGIIVGGFGALVGIILAAAIWFNFLV